MSPVLRTLIFTIFVPGFWTVAMPYWLLPRGMRPDLHGVGAFGGVLIAAGIVLYFACALWGFAFRGRGTPLPLDPPKKLVVEGPYRIVRNPMYWSVCFVMLGEAAFFRSYALLELVGVFAVGVKCVCPTLRGAHSSAEIRGGVRSVLQARAEVVPAVPTHVGRKQGE